MRHFMAQFGPDAAAAVDEADRRARAHRRARSTRSSRSPTPRRTAATSASSSACATTASSRSCRACATHDVGAGAVLADYERALFADAPAAARTAATTTAPLRLHATVVAPEWIDYNGHAHESRYLQVFGDTTDALLRHIGLDLDARQQLLHGRDAPLAPRPGARRTSACTRRRRSSATTTSACTSSTRCTAPTTTPCSRPPSRCCSTSTRRPSARARPIRRCSSGSSASRRRTPSLPRPERAGRAIGIPG